MRLASGAGHDAVALERADRRGDALRALRRRHQPPSRRVGRRGRRGGRPRRAARLRAPTGAMSDVDLLHPRRRRRDVAVADGRDRRGRARARRPGARGDRRARAAGAARRGRRPRPPQRARARRLGGLRHRDRRAGGGRDDVRDRHAAQRDAADDRRRGVRRQGRGGHGRRARRRGAVGRPGARRPRPPRRARRSAASSGFKAFMSASGVEEFAAADDLTLLEGMARAARAGAARRRARRERGAHAPPRAPARWPRGGWACATTWPRGPSLAELEAIGRAIAFARRDRLRAARRPRLQRPRRGARRAGPRPRGGRDVRDVPALPRPRRGRRRAPGRGGQVRAAAARPPRSARRCGRRCAPATSTSSPPTTRPRPAALKEGDDFFAVWGGIAGAQTLLALLYDEGVVARGLAPARARRAARGGARRAASAWRRQGRARGGRRRRRRAGRPVGGRGRSAREELLDRHRLSPFVGRALRGRVVRTILRGAHDRARRADRGAAQRARGAPRRLGFGAVTALHDAIAELAQFNDDPAAGGITREVYTPTYATALEWVAERMRAADLETAPGRRWATSSAAGPAAIPTRRSCSPARTSTRRSTRGATTACWGCSARSRRCARCARPACARGARSRSSPGPARSRASGPAAWAAARRRGELQRADLDRLRDRDGTSMADALRAAGLDPDRLADARIDPATVHALVELHIEQGIVLETHGEQIGVVTAIAAPHDFRLTFRGAATHAGATPMGLRRDALAGAAEAMVALERAARESASGTTVATVGVLRARPGRSTWCPARSSSTSTCATATCRRASRWSTRSSPRLARSPGAVTSSVEVTPIVEDVPVACDPAVVRGGRGGVPRARALPPPDDQRRLPRRDDHGPPRAGRDGLRPQRRRRQPPPRRVHRARRPRSRRPGAGGNARAAGGLAGGRLRAWR